MKSIIPKLFTSFIFLFLPYIAAQAQNDKGDAIIYKISNYYGKSAEIRVPSQVWHKQPKLNLWTDEIPLSSSQAIAKLKEYLGQSDKYSADTLRVYSVAFQTGFVQQIDSRGIYYYLVELTPIIDSKNSTPVKSLYFAVLVTGETYCLKETP